jgi:hypothetical protein
MTIMTTAPLAVGTDRPVNGFESLAIIQGLLLENNQKLITSYGKNQTNQSELLDHMSAAADNRAREVSKAVATYLEQVQNAAHTPLWKTIVTCVLAVVAIVLSSFIPFVGPILATALAAYFVLNQMPVGMDANGNPKTLKNLMEDAGMPKWAMLVVNAVILVAATAASCGVAGAAAGGGAATWAALGVGSSLLGTSGVIGDSCELAGVDPQTVQWINLGVGIGSALASMGCMAGLYSAFGQGVSAMPKFMTGLQIGAQLGQSSAEVANGVIKHNQYEAVAETSEKIGEMKSGSRSQSSMLDSMNAMSKQSADGMVQAQNDLVENISAINQGYTILGRIMAETAA